MIFVSNVVHEEYESLLKSQNLLGRSLDKLKIVS